MTKPHIAGRAPTTRLPPVGQCIYCGATGVPLSEEHMIPFALGGNLVLPDASCESCRVITGNVEQNAIKSMYEIVRVRTGAPTRRPKSRKTALRSIVTTNGVTETIDIPQQDFPITCFALALHLPRLLDPENTPPGAFRVIPTLLRNPGANWTQHVSAHAPGSDIKLALPPLRLREWGRMLAKIAHCAAVASEGVDGFTPLLPPIILREDINPFDLVGGWPFPVEEHLARKASSHVEVSLSNENGIVYVVVEMTLLIALRGPTYVVVAGTKP